MNKPAVTKAQAQRMVEGPEPSEATAAWIAAAEDLLTHPRHDISAKGRRWLRAALRGLRGR